MTPDTPPGALHLDLSQSLDQVPRARRAVRDWLRTSGMQRHTPAAELLVSELVTNALRHGRPPMALRLRTHNGQSLRIEVLDGAADGEPVPTEAPPDAVTGRGLGIVAALARRWGTESVPGGKLVWAELDHTEH